jgi:hypothetical protein
MEEKEQKNKINKETQQVLAREMAYAAGDNSLGAMTNLKPGRKRSLKLMRAWSISYSNSLV